MGGNQVDKESLAEKFQKLNATQHSIETTSAYCIFYRRDAKTVVSLWETEFISASTERKLALLYLANHVLQESRKKGREFQEQYYKVLPRALKLILREDPKVKKQVHRLLGIWEERRVFGQDHITPLRVSCGLAATDRQEAGGVSQEERQKLHLVGHIADSLISAQKAADVSAEWQFKALQPLSKAVIERGTLDDLNSALTTVNTYLASLDHEIRARNKVVMELREIVTAQEDALSRAHQALAIYRTEQGRITGRIRDISSANSNMQGLQGLGHSYQESGVRQQAYIQSPHVKPEAPALTQAAMMDFSVLDPAAVYAQVQQAITQAGGTLTATNPHVATATAEPAGSGQQQQQQQQQSVLAVTSEQAGEGGAAAPPTWASGEGSGSAAATSSEMTAEFSAQFASGMAVLNELVNAQAPADAGGGAALATAAVGGDAVGGGAEMLFEMNFDDIARVAESLANNDQSADILAMALQALPAEDLHKIGMGLTEQLEEVPSVLPEAPPGSPALKQQQQASTPMMEQPVDDNDEYDPEDPD